MEHYFICPHCRGQLKVGNHVIFRVRNRKKEYGILLLHPQIGNYESITHPRFGITEGENLQFFCPLCSHSLGTDFDENLAYVVMIDPAEKEFDIYFSKIAGEQSTYQVKGETVRASGKHSGRYTYFRMSPKFKRFLKS